MKFSEAHRLENNQEYLHKLWLEKQKKFHLETWSLIIAGMSDKIGVCDYNKRQITISSIFLMGSSCNYSRVKKALMHEIAHALTPGHSHDHVWKKTCGKIGGDCQLAGVMNEPGMNWAMYCRTCRWRNEYISRPNTAGLLCGKCRNPVLVKSIH